jgi:hypothetical protein
MLGWIFFKKDQNRDNISQNSYDIRIIDKISKIFEGQPRKIDVEELNREVRVYQAPDFN